ncbi:MAG: hypothetical protein SPE43_07990 [Ruminococcus sp.]|nr:hypothetical protein [Ruminococcus sp.]
MAKEEKIIALGKKAAYNLADVTKNKTAVRCDNTKVADKGS